MAKELLSHDTTRAVAEELYNAQKKHGDFASAHEAIAVIREEYLELEREVFKRTPDPYSMRFEAIQLGAMALKLAEYLIPRKEV